MGGLLLLVTGLIFSGCNGIEMKYTKNSSNKSKHIKNIGSMPLEFKEHALISNGDITIGGNLLAQGPLADIHTNSDFKATKDIKTSGKITAFSLDTKNAKIATSGKNTVSKTTTKKEIAALRVSDAILENTFENGVIFDANGNVFEVINGSLHQADINILGGAWSYSQNGWSVRTGELVLRKAVKFETDVFFDVESLTALKPIYVQGNLKTSYGLNINTGELFEDVLVVDKNLQLDSLATVGRVHIGGDLIASGSVDIAGNLEIEGSTTVGGDLKLNYLDVVYKAALFSAQEKFNETLLVDSQVFKDVNGKNSIAMFTFVKGYYQLNEQTIFDLLDTNQTGDFEFFTVVLGATIDYASEIVRYDGISPYYKNKLNTINELKKQGYYETEVAEALNLPVMDMYLTFTDKYGNKIGTYLMDSFDKQIDNTLVELNEISLQNAKAYIENKTAGADINTSFIETLDEETKSLIEPNSSKIADFLNEIESNETKSFLETEQNISSLKEIYASKSDQEVHAEAEDMRVSEWLSYNNLDENIEEIEVTQIVVDSSKITGSKHTNSWLSKKLKKLQ
ncbi:MAG: hypothetical protein QG567_219, partial [Campylobacterota bacterium]|nr:hypothetical protein [Campylobacterota bacterium]